MESTSVRSVVGWAVPRKDLTLKSKIGNGEFGGQLWSVKRLTCYRIEVWLGEYKGTSVAVKMLKEMKTSQATQQFLAEASIMT